MLVWLVAGSIPAAIVGGALVLPAVLLKRLLAWVLLFSAWRLTLFQPVPSVELRVPMALAVMAGGWFGAWCGSSRFEPLWIRRILAGVLLLASGKLLGLVA